MGHSFPLSLAQYHLCQVLAGHIEKQSHAKDKKVLKRLRGKYKWSDSTALTERESGS